MQRHSALPQSFMVLSFVSAGLLLTVQLLGQGRSLSSNSQARERRSPSTVLPQPITAFAGAGYTPQTSRSLPDASPAGTLPPAVSQPLQDPGTVWQHRAMTVSMPTLFWRWSQRSPSTATLPSPDITKGTRPGQPHSLASIADTSSHSESGATPHQAETTPTASGNLAANSATTQRLVVDLSDRTLIVYENDEPLETYPIGVGKAGWETPVGEFRVMHMEKDPVWRHPLTGELMTAADNSPLGSRWIGFWTDGIHQIGFHGTNQAESIGKAISHGCIRLHDADVQELYDRVAMGALVVVQP